MTLPPNRAPCMHLEYTQLRAYSRPGISSHLHQQAFPKLLAEHDLRGYTELLQPGEVAKRSKYTLVRGQGLV